PGCSGSREICSFRSWMGMNPSSILPIQLESQLNLARGPRRDNLPEAIARDVAGRVRDGAGVVEPNHIRIRRPLALIERVDQLGTELQPNRLGGIEVLREVQVPLVAARLPERRAPGIAERARR